VTPQNVLRSDQAIRDHVGEEHLAAPDSLREEAPLSNLVLSFLVDLESQPFRANLLSVLSPLLVEVADAPNSRALGSLEQPSCAVLAALSWS
jgi:hypothetical protein